MSFAIGIAFTSVWYPKANQGTALGIFGAGNAGTALTTLFAPTLLNTPVEWPVAELDQRRSESEAVPSGRAAGAQGKR